MTRDEAFSYPIRFLVQVAQHVASISTSGREMRADIAAFKAENVGEPLEVFLQWRKESEGLSCWVWSKTCMLVERMGCMLKPTKTLETMKIARYWEVDEGHMLLADVFFFKI